MKFFQLATLPRAPSVPELDVQRSYFGIALFSRRVDERCIFFHDGQHVGTVLALPADRNLDDATRDDRIVQEAEFPSACLAVL